MEIYLTPPQIAQELKVDQSTVRTWIYSGYLKATKTLTGRYHIDPDDHEIFKKEILYTLYD